jgi:FkbH-like protein
LWIGDAATAPEPRLLSAEEDFQAVLRRWCEQGRLDVLARLWAAGVELDWPRLWGDLRPGRIPLPTSAFQGRRHWVTDLVSSMAGPERSAPALAAVAVPAPLSSPALADGRTPTEAYVAAIWSEVLGVADVGPSSEFLMLGGNSVLLTQVLSRFEELRIEFRMSELLEAPTVSDIARLIDRALASSPDAARGRALIEARLAGEARTPSRDSSAVVAAAPLAPLAVALPSPVTKANGAAAGHRASTSETAPPPPRAEGPPAEAGRQLRPRPAGSDPLSRSQERFWFLNSLMPESGAFNLPAAVRMRVPFDGAALERSSVRALERHDAARTVFPSVAGRPTLRLGDARVAVEVVDLGAEEAEREKLLEARLARFAAAPFDLNNGPLVRLLAVELGEADTLVMLVMHHIVSDAWSVGILLREILTLYRAELTSSPIVLPRPEIQFGDYAAWERERLAEACARDLPFWTKKLAHLPGPINLAQDRERPATPSFRAGRVRLDITGELADRLREFSRAHRVSLFVTLLAGFNALIRRVAGADDVLVGCPIANRERPETAEMVGCLANVLVMRTRVRAEMTAAELIAATKETFYGAIDHREAPFPDVVAALSAPRAANYNPLYQVVFNVVPMPALPDGVELLDVPTGFVDTDLFVRFEDGPTSLRGFFDYATDLFDHDTAVSLVDAYRQVLTTLTEAPAEQALLDALSLPPELARRAAASAPKGPAFQLNIASTFVDVPLLPTLEMWWTAMGARVRTELSDYNQVFPALLDAHTGFASNPDGLNVAIVRFADWSRFDAGRDAESLRREQLRNVCDLADSALNAKRRLSGPLLLLVLPALEADREHDRELLDTLLARTSGQRGLYVKTGDDVLAAYPVAEIFDRHGDDQAHIPYTHQFYAAVATFLARTAYGLFAQPPKVIVVDCDETLWAGVVGEDGPEQIRVDSARSAFQRRLVAQHGAGRLLAVASKNELADVKAVFERNPGMVLRPEHIVAWNVGWDAKPDGLRALARQLNLGLDSFVFIDDNPLECAAVRSACPEVTVLQFPREQADISAFTAALWMLDSDYLTAEDRTRTLQYRAQFERDRERTQHGSLAAFIASLALEVEIASLSGRDIDRVHQLTLRTNQFNTTARRRTPSEVAAFGSAGGFECLTCRVRDRFGDYGLTGVAIFRVEQRTLVVDALLLSCRVLSKGIEHQLIAALGRLAQERGLERVLIAYVPTERNTPARRFLDALGAEVAMHAGGDRSYGLSAAQAAACTFLPDAPQADGEDTSASDVPPPRAGSAFDTVRLVELATALPDAQHVADEAAKGREVRAPARRAAASAPPASRAERTVAEVFGAVLGLEQVGIDDNFFDLGGTSISSVEVAGVLSERFSAEVSLVKIFQYPTVRLLARYLTQGDQRSGKGGRARGERQRETLRRMATAVGA